MRRYFLDYVIPFRRPLLIALFSLVASIAFALLKPWPLKFLFDRVLTPASGSTFPISPRAVVWLIGGAVILIAAGEGLLGYVQDYFLNTATQRISFGLRTALFSRIQHLPLTYHEKQSTGDLLTRIINDVDKTQDILSQDLVSNLGGLLTAVGMIVVLLSLDWQLALLMLITAPLVVVISGVFRTRIRHEEQNLRLQEGQMASLAQESLSSIKMVKTYAGEEQGERSFKEKGQKAVDAAVRVARLEGTFGWLLNVSLALGLASIVVLGAFHALAKIITVGTLVLAISYVKDFYSPVRSLSKLSTKISRAQVRLERISEVLSQEPEVSESATSREAPPFQGRLTFEKVSFEHTPGIPALADISLDCAPGEVISVVGPTGAGKSTLASLILRLYDPTSGRVLIDGEDVRNFKLTSLRNQIAMVLQDTVLFHTTVWENVAYGCPEASHAELQAACRATGAHNFIMALPDGYDTVLGERGSTISGGQRQLIAISRALARNASLLILDEPTSNLDARSEAEVIRALKKLMSGRTTLLITHKLALVEGSDLIIVLQNGRIVERGRHAELKEAGGLYAELYRACTTLGETLSSEETKLA